MVEEELNDYVVSIVQLGQLKVRCTSPSEAKKEVRRILARSIEANGTQRTLLHVIKADWNVTGWDK